MTTELEYTLVESTPESTLVEASEPALASHDHVTRGRARLPVQFRDKPNMRALVDSRSEQAQEIEDAFQQLRTLLDIENSEGAQLDMIGKIVGQPRGGYDDAKYRVWLRVRVRLNRSNGRPGDVLQIMRLAVGAGPTIHYRPEPPAGFTVTIHGLTEDADAMRAILDDTTAAGVRSLFEYSESPEDELFRFDVGPGFDVGSLAGVSE